MKFRTIEPRILFWNPSRVGKFAKRGWNYEPGADLLFLGAWLDSGFRPAWKRPRPADNFHHYPECVVNLPAMWPEVEKLASLSGKRPVPELKECAVHLEAKVTQLHQRLQYLGGGVAAEIEILRVHVASEFIPTATILTRKSGHL
jgi:Conserved protein/domain typically associated with flavoprotein oxygenases, DIM6/NTAB family